jgi:sulfatase maturation enzyme AslB (radical SAM superfamily)
MAVTPVFGFEGVQAKITLSLACNNDCLFCYNRNDKAAARPLAEERVVQLIEEAADTGATQLNFIGGEVTILPYFPRVLAHGGKHFHSISINTNGRRFADPDFARRCAATGLTEIDVSLHGSKPEIHDTVSRAPGAWQDTTQGLRNLARVAAEHGGKPLRSITTIVLDWNLADLGDLGDLVAELGVSSWRIKYAYGALGGHEAGKKPSDYIVRYQVALPVLQRVVERHAHRLDIVVHDIPTCLLGELHEYSTLYERHSVARYGESGCEETVRVIDRWGETSTRCSACAARQQCCHLSRAYVALYGDSELAPLDEAAWKAIRERGRVFRARLEAAAPRHGRGTCRGGHEPPEITAAFAAINQAAGEGRWQAVRDQASEILAIRPGHAEALRMRRLAESHLLNRLADLLVRSGQPVRARRIRTLLKRHYVDLNG